MRKYDVTRFRDLIVSLFRRLKILILACDVKQNLQIDAGLDSEMV